MIEIFMKLLRKRIKILKKIRKKSYERFVATVNELPRKGCGRNFKKKIAILLGVILF